MKYHVSYDIELKKNTYGGLFVAIEGIDGSGKTTQTDHVARLLQHSGKQVIVTREPTNKGVIGTLIREILQSRVQIPSVALQYLFVADRAVHQQETIIKALQAGNIVVSDRCFWSGIPYGMVDRGIPKESTDILLVAYSILSMYHEFLAPDVTFYLDISADVAMQRLSRTKKTQEIYEKKEKLENIEKGYKWLMQKFPEVMCVIQGNRDPHEITKEMVAKILKSQ